MRKLSYKDGYAIVVHSMEIFASEYHVEREKYFVEVVFHSQVGIKRFASYVGERVLPKGDVKELIAKKKRADAVSYYCHLHLEQIPTESHPLWYPKRGIGYNYQNTYKGRGFHTTIPTTKDGLKEALKGKDFAELYEDAMVGSVANGCSFKSLVNSYVSSRNVISNR